MRRWLLAALALCACADPGLGALEEPVVGGVADNGRDPAVVIVKLFDANHRLNSLCSGTIITPRIVLTAAHCLLNQTSADIAFAESWNARTNGYTGLLDTVPRHSTVIWSDPGFAFDPASGTSNDLALIAIDAEPPSGVEPVPFARTRVAASLIGTPDRFVGFGDQSGGSSSNLYEKRFATATLGAISTQSIGWTSGGAMTCEGDSGGPHLLITPTGEQIFAVTSYGDTSCNLQSFAQRLDVAIDSIVDFIAANDPQPSRSCGADGVCGWGCPDIDPDCPCVKDGRCTPACAEPDLDPDCPLNCKRDGVCVRAGCPAPDPDCGESALGQSCSSANECASDVCAGATSGAGVCSQACDAANLCPVGFGCVDGHCLLPPGGGCAVGGGAGGGLWLVLGTLARLGLGRRRHRVRDRRQLA